LPAATWSWARIVRLRLDHAYVRGAQVVGAGVATRARGSDHRPIWVEVETAAGGQLPPALVQTAP
jgi:endonuclease/exonuclease/phosphatase (EEP) superfamily protein YafD